MVMVNHNFGPDGDRGLGKKLLIAGAAIAAVAAVAVIGGVVYKKSKKKKVVQTKDGKTREIEVEAFVDESGRELPGQVFDEYGNLVNEQEILSRAQTPAPGAGQYGTPALPPQQQGYNSQCQPPSYGGYPQQQYYGAPPQQPNFAPPPYASQPYCSQPGYNSAPYGAPSYGAPPPNAFVPPAQFAPPQQQGYGSYGGPAPMNAASMIGNISPYPTGPY